MSRFPEFVGLPTLTKTVAFAFMNLLKKQRIKMKAIRTLGFLAGLLTITLSFLILSPLPAAARPLRIMIDIEEQSDSFAIGQAKSAVGSSSTTGPE